MENQNKTSSRFQMMMTNTLSSMSAGKMNNPGLFLKILIAKEPGLRRAITLGGITDTLKFYTSLGILQMDLKSKNVCN